jgi:hypothetical protein
MAFKNTRLLQCNQIVTYCLVVPGSLDWIKGPARWLGQEQVTCAISSSPICPVIGSRSTNGETLLMRCPLFGVRSVEPLFDCEETVTFCG